MSGGHGGRGTTNWRSGTQEGRGEKLSRIAMIDDARSGLTARFVGHDSTEEHLRQLGCNVKQHGRPLSVHTDKPARFR